MEKKFYENFSSEITQERLSVYRADGCDDETALARYLYNIKLCKSLYSSLNMFEIALRNSVDKALQNFTSTSDWFEKLRLVRECTKSIESAKEKIQKRKKPITHNRVISELTLGFWTSLFSKRYAQEKFQPYIIKQCFRNVPKAERSATSLWNNFEKIRHLRNRVFHYERLIHWRDLKERHEKLLEFTELLAPNSYKILLKTDEFSIIYSAGITSTLQSVKDNFNKDDLDLEADKL
ncbi:MAG: hypothetical protein HDR54_02520 [Treponema sp.]|nr:hypothetical protein [Treponema sp.]